MNDATSTAPVSGSTDSERVEIPGWSRARFLIALLLAALLVAAFTAWTQGWGQGIGAAVALGLCAIAVGLLAGPVNRARTLSLDAERLRITRWTRVVSTVRREELTGLSVVESPAALQLDPKRPEAFFAAHPELAGVRQHDAALVPLGRTAGAERARELLTRA